MPTSEVRDHGWERIRREVLQYERSFTKVGLPHGGEPGPPDNLSLGEPRGMVENILVGAVHEFGAPARNIPERSWLRSAFDNNRRDIHRLVMLEYQRVIQGTSTARLSLAKLGEWFTARVKANFPPSGVPGYAPSTLRAKLRKGETDPQLLIETGQLRNSVQHEEVMHGG